MSEKESEGGKDNQSKRLMEPVDSKDPDDDEKRSMRKKPRVDYSEEKKPTPTVGEPPKLDKEEDDDDDIQVWVL